MYPVSQADLFFQAECCLLELLSVLPLLKQWPLQKGHSNNSRNRLIGGIHALGKFPDTEPFCLDKTWQQKHSLKHPETPKKNFKHDREKNWRQMSGVYRHVHDAPTVWDFYLHHGLKFMVTQQENIPYIFHTHKNLWVSHTQGWFLRSYQHWNFESSCLDWISPSWQWLP